VLVNIGEQTFCTASIMYNDDDDDDDSNNN